MIENVDDKKSVQDFQMKRQVQDGKLCHFSLIPQKLSVTTTGTI